MVTRWETYLCLLDRATVNNGSYPRHQSVTSTILAPEQCRAGRKAHVKKRKTYPHHQTIRPNKLHQNSNTRYFATTVRDLNTPTKIQQGKAHLPARSTPIQSIEHTHTTNRSTHITHGAHRSYSSFARALHTSKHILLQRPLLVDE